MPIIATLIQSETCNEEICCDDFSLEVLMEGTRAAWHEKCSFT